MLLKLDIANYALIENALVDFPPQFSVITGETGAGKSILLKALHLLMGERADTAVLKSSGKKCVLEATFDVRQLALSDFFDEHELDEEEMCVVRREFTPTGKSRCFVNDTPVQVVVLKKLGEKLIHIHNQHDATQLFKPAFQLEVLDNFSKLSDAVYSYRKGYRDYRQKVTQHRELQSKEREHEKEREYAEFLLGEFEAIDLEHTDWEALHRRHRHIEYAEKIAAGLQRANSIFDDEAHGPLNGINALVETFETLKDDHPHYADLYDRLLSVKIECNDLAAEVGNQSDEMEMSEQEVLRVKEKIDALNALLFKHRVSDSEALVQLQYQLRTQLEGLSHSTGRRRQLEGEIKALKERLTEEANAIQVVRKQQIEPLCALVKEGLARLGMEAAELAVEHQPLSELSADGLDAIAFAFRTNKGSAFLPLQKVVSGGELSRLVVVILSLLSETKQLPTLIFDEIDTGVSGEIASKIAREFAKMGAHLQLIAITHLPQVAAKGSVHLYVSKSTENEKAISAITVLNEEQRVHELAKMMSGESVTESARESALHLLHH